MPTGASHSQFLGNQGVGDSEAGNKVVEVPGRNKTVGKLGILVGRGS